MRHLYCYKGYYYFHAKVPTDLQVFFDCATIKKGLKTNDYKTSVSSVKLVSNEFDRVIKVMRSGVLSKEQMNQLVREFFNDYIKKREFRSLSRTVRRDEKYKRARIKECDGLLEKYHRHLEGNRHYYDETLVSFLRSHDIEIEKTSYEFLKLRRDFIIALIKATEIEKERLQNNFDNWYDDFTALLRKEAEEPTKKKTLLSAVIQEYTKEKIQKKEWNDKNRDETIAFYNQLVEILGDKDIGDYSRFDLLKYQGLLVKFPANIRKHKELRDLPLAEIIALIKNDTLPSCKIISTKTVNKNLIRVNAVFDYAQKMGYRPTNPAFGLKISVKGTKESEERDSYSKQDIEGLLSSPVYIKADIRRPERFWIPLIGLYGGLRLGEICQLYKTDVIEDFSIPYFDINENMPDKALKTKSSKRLVPIHPVLIELGFLTFVKSIKDERLWCNLKKRRDGYGHDFSRWYNSYEDKHITDHSKKSFHSLRHTFINTLKQVIVTDKAFGLDKVLSEIVGHSNDSITMDRYGKESLLQTKLDLIKRLDYGIDLSHLKFPLKKKG